MKRKFLSLVLLGLISTVYAKGQTAEVTIQLNEQFFDALVEAIFKNANAPEFSLSENRVPENTSEKAIFTKAFSESKNENAMCKETVKLQRQIDGVNTTVRFREGKIFAPIAFTGNYNPPLIGCIDFSGWAETNIELEFNRQTQTLTGRAKVLRVNLSGTGGVGSSLIARLVQSSIDKKINPINILQLEKISFAVPVQNAGSLKMKAVGVRPEILNGVLNVHLTYEFQKAE